MRRIVFALAIAAMSGIVKGDTISYTSSTSWNFGLTQEHLDLTFPVQYLPAQSTITEAKLNLSQSTVFDGPGTAIACSSGFTPEGTYAGWGSVNWCSREGFALYLNQLFVFLALPGGGTYFGSGGVQDYFALASDAGDNLLKSHLQPLVIGVDVGISSTFAGWEVGPSPPFPNPLTPGPKNYGNSAVGHADVTLTLTYDAPPGSVFSPEPSTFALVGLLLAGMGARLLQSRRS